MASDRRGRVRTGCLTCRSRKVKCDETQPVCRNCTRLERHCVYQIRKTRSRPGTDIGASPLTTSLTRRTTGSPPRQESQETTPSTRPDHNQASASRPRYTTLSSSTLQPDSDAIARTEPFGHPDIPIVNVTAQLEKALEDRQSHRQQGCPFRDGLTQDGEENSVDGEPASLISRDIELTTTMDLLVSCEDTSQVKSLFVTLVECPGITTFDAVNWDLAKRHMVNASAGCSAILSGMTAVATLFNAQAYSMPLSKAISIQHATQTSFEELLANDEQNQDHCLMVVFLICLFDLVHRDEEPPFFKTPSELFLNRLDCWGRYPGNHSALSMRLVAWLRILQVVTLRGGGSGLLARSICDLLPRDDRPLTSLSPPASERLDLSMHLYEVLSAPAFDFYYRLQLLSGEIAQLTHYHRSRTKGTDQQEVTQLMTHIKSQLQALWDTRPPVQRQSPQELREQLAPRLAGLVISLAGVCNAAYHTELVEIERVLGDPVSKSTVSKESQRAIRNIVDEECERTPTGLNPGYLRALFLYAIECMDKEQNRWAVHKIRQIESPVYRSKFFAAFAQELADAQIRKERRVTSMYFCLWYFRMPPPYM
ncbi:unnamed protein product [Zymoseptoria tritici ST99CH_1E4]|uniref:Zn(2)-C6 fungal-type domain-containing protein n=1 Tax=Zymoseptoria tritici ST99CH_1E4 TaxID=1276532 RepID=A0A2H1GHN2_ZYMTR|nr:unnamed protein product [Zymoseptoria tritici ST99CH_1E4]